MIFPEKRLQTGTRGRTTRFWPLLLAGLLASADTGCDRPQNPPPQARKRFPEPQRIPRPAPAPLVQPEIPANELPREGPLPIYELRMDPKELMALERNPGSNDTHPGNFIAEGQLYERVKVRYRGAFARAWPKKPLKIFFNDKKTFRGQSRVNLNSGWRDPAFIREALAYHVYAACNAPASQSRMVRLDVNGQFRGLYIEVEQPDKAFLNRLNLKGASIYKASSRSNMADERDLGSEPMFRSHYEKETQKSEGYADLVRFCQELARTRDVADFFNQHVDLEKYINYLAATTLTQNWDGYNKNHFIVFDGRKKCFLVPWDLDRTFGDHWNWSFDAAELPVTLGTRQAPGITGWNRIQDRFFSDPTLRARFMTRLAELLENEFTTEKLFPLLDKMESDISEVAALDRRRWPSQTSDLHRGIAQVKSFIERRRAFLLREIGSSSRN